jgi:PncC family amidohydrolase
MDENLVRVVKGIGKRLAGKGLMLGIAESCTGGLVASSITALPGASTFFAASVVSYSGEAKRRLLGIRETTLRRYGAISEEAAIEMARAIAKRARVRVSLAVTGNAGPGAQEGKDVGLVYMAVVIDGAAEAKCMRFRGSRQTVRKRAALESLRFLERVMRVWL